MDKDFETKYHQLESSHFWFYSRRRMVQIFVNRHAMADSRILEIGCSSGHLINDLLNQGYRNITGIDISESGITEARRKGISQAHVMDGSKLEFEDESFDIITSSDVLEHIENESDALSEWYRVLKHGGKIIIFVPAFQFLWSDHDEINHHYRRYTRSELLSKVKSSGLTPIGSGYWNFSLFWPVSMIRLFSQFGRGHRHDNVSKDHGQLFKLPGFVNSFLRYLLCSENIWINRVSALPIGLSTYVIAEKK